MAADDPIKPPTRLVDESIASASATDTLLTRPTSPEIEAEMRRREDMIDQARIIVFDAYLQGYKDGDIKFEDMCREAKKVVQRLGEGHQERILGKLVNSALRIPVPPRRSRRGKPLALRSIVAAVVELISKAESLSKVAEGDLWERTAEVFTALGVELSAKQVRTFYYES